MTDQIINVQHLTKKYGTFTAVNDISFSVGEGEIFGFLGPNGAGKTTTIKMICTIAEPTCGEISVNGYSTRRDQNTVRATVGLIFQDPSLDNNLTVHENLYFHAKLYHVPAGEIKPRIDAALELVNLADRRKSIVRILSGGMKRRVEIARGILHTPTILFLDEPTIGLDPQTRKHIWEYILALKEKENMTMFLTTHYMEEAEYCDRIAVIDNGKIIALDTPANLKNMVRGDQVVIKTSDKDKTLKRLEEQTGFEPVIRGDNIHLTVPSGRDEIPKLFKLLGDDIVEFDVKKTSLDDVFLHLTGREIREDTASAHDRMKQRAKMRRKI
ncbi:MAG: ATP-binding cassette domain-containing protein [Spirochaetales bacterium]|nr:ATP-binding cassette domain-containing protein [Spirochaetales bacterium]